VTTIGPIIVIRSILCGVHIVAQIVKKCL